MTRLLPLLLFVGCTVPGSSRGPADLVEGVQIIGGQEGEPSPPSAEDPDIDAGAGGENLDEDTGDTGAP